MFWTRARWTAKCFGCLLLAYPVLYLLRSLTALVWAALAHAGATNLRVGQFSLRYDLPLCGIYGFSLGLISLIRLRELFFAITARFRTKPVSVTPLELDWRRPLLWAWVPLAALLSGRILLWTDPNASVLNQAKSLRWDHFFGAPPFSEFSYMDPNLQAWYFQGGGNAWSFDRYVLTGPLLFLLAYVFGVWFRHQLPSRPLPEVEGVGPSEADEGG